MARRYLTQGAADVGTSLTVLGITSTTAIRPRIYDIVVGCGATPADTATKFAMIRNTAAGTVGTSFTPIALDPSDPAATFTSGYDHSAEPTYTSNAYLLTFSMNQRSTFRWVAAPGSELVAPATAANGIGLRSLASTGTAIHEATFLVEE